MRAIEFLNNQKAILCKNLVSVDMAQFLTHVLLRKAAIEPALNDSLVPDSLTTSFREVYMETLQERLWPQLEETLGIQLLPTYSYSRLYVNGNKLDKHVDRAACEISLTIQLGRSHNYAWPIYMGDNRYDLNEGDAVLYLGCAVPHWREECDGPKDYYSGQMFMHFVRKNGPFIDQYGDPTYRTFKPTPELFVKDRPILMLTK